MNSNGIITAPVRLLADVKAVLGESVNTLSGLCTSANINWASIFKPVYIASPVVSRTASANWWRGTAQNCGIVPKQLSSYTAVASAMTDDLKNGWYYQPPTGYFRLGDFDKYYHYAEFPISEWECQTSVTKGNSFQAQLVFNSENSTHDGATEAGSLGIGDIYFNGTSLGDFKFGIYVTTTSGTSKGRVIGTQDTATFSTSGLTAGQTYYLYPFLALYAAAQDGDDDASNVYLTCPFCERKSITVASATSSAYLYIDEALMDTSGTITYTLSASVSLTVTSGYVYILDGSTTVKTVAISSTTISTTKFLTGTVAGLDPTYEYQIKVTVTTSNGYGTITITDWVQYGDVEESEAG